MDKKSISIPEMGKILGLSKGASCYLVRQGRFKTIKIGRQTRIYLDSFEEWYGGQFHYKKVNGDLPGAIISETTWSIQEVAALLGVCEDTVYQHLKRGSFKSEVVDCRTRIDKIDFQRWFNSQSYYKSLNMLPGKDDA